MERRFRTGRVPHSFAPALQLLNGHEHEPAFADEPQLMLNVLLKEVHRDADARGRL